MAEKADEKISKPTDEEISSTMKENYLNEKEQFEKALKDKKEGKERFQRQWDRDKEIWELKLNGAKKITPNYEFEENPRYWELMKDVIRDQMVQDQHVSESKLKQMDEDIKSLQEQLDSINDALEKLEN